jgi:MipA family protein
MRGLNPICAVVMLCAAVVAQADAPDSDCEGNHGDCAAVGTWNFSLGVGIGARTNPLDYQHPIIPMVFIPQFSYYGKRFFVDNLDAGYTLTEGKQNTLSLLATPAYDTVFFNTNYLEDVLLGGSLNALGSAFRTNPLKPRSRSPDELTYLFGVEWSARFAGLSTQLDILHDTNWDVGVEIRAGVGLPPLRLPRGSLTANLGITWKNSNYVTYYYGSLNEAPRAAANPFLTLRYSLPLTKAWRFGPYVQYERLGIGIAASGLVAREYVLTAFLGAYHDF